MPDFVAGRELSRLFYTEAVSPILRSEYPDLAHSAGLLGPGSEVLGFDDEMSADHNWGPRVLLFLRDEDQAHLGAALGRMLGYRLPASFRGHPTHFEEVPGDPGSVVPAAAARRPINHRVEVVTLPVFLRDTIGVELDRDLSTLDWLTIPEQKLRSLVDGAVYHDGLGVLAPMRRRLAYYPHDLWLYLLSAQWQRVGQEEPFVGRTGIAGDEAGSAVIAARLVRDLMRLSLLMARQYAPYPKWLGTAFAQLDCAESLKPIVEQVLQASGWQEREGHLAAAYEMLAELHNGLGITEPVPTRVSRFHDRPFMVIDGERIARAIWDAIRDEDIKTLPYGIGKVDQFLDSTDVLSDMARCQKLRTLYEGRSDANDAP